MKKDENQKDTTIDEEIETEKTEASQEGSRVKELEEQVSK
jgi:hypothetical protein